MASSSRGIQQDSFIDEDDLTCPLCVEEFDLSDRNFRPCPCGYQVCQFCFNNIKTNMNGLCPACRRPYDEKTIEWKVVTPEEIAQFKAKIQKDARKKAEARQKEAQKREVENLNRKHLAGLRVVQKNLVYVVGLSHGIPEQDLLQTLRGEKYFGQYGKIIKIVVSKAKSPDHNSSLGVYVTFARKEDAAKCIAAVNGSTNLDRTLRAQLGTTKYCSAYLRNETCTNKQCMFLHEPGDNEDSYSRQDLSSINSVGTQRPLPGTSSSRQNTQVQAPIQQAQPIAAASQPMARETSKEGSESGDGSALPSSASWANRGTHQLSRRESGATSGATCSPAASTSVPAPMEIQECKEVANDSQDQSTVSLLAERSSKLLVEDLARPQRNPVLMRLIKSVSCLRICAASFAEDSFDDMGFSSFPPLFDDQGGIKRKALREQQAETRLPVDQDSQHDMLTMSDHQEEEEHPESGSLQLGGEPEDRNDAREGTAPTQSFHDQRRQSAQPLFHRASHDSGLFGSNSNSSFSANLSSITGRTLTPLQQQQLMLIKSGQLQSGFMDQITPTAANSSQASPFQHQTHNRQSSRYNFSNDGSFVSASKAVPGSKIGVGQQSIMQPQQFYGSSMPGPPPGLKSTGNPPVNASGIFGQSHGFANSLGNATGFGGARENNGDLLRDMLRNRSGMTSGGQLHDAGKREFMFPSFLNQYPSASTPAPASGLLASLYGPQPGAFQDFSSKQKKKGKKHRYANTSSSGGGGLVDLADPNMFQARMTLQQQSNAGVGQGQFGGQGQDDDFLPSLDESTIVDALVADNVNEFIGLLPSSEFGGTSRSLPPLAPPGLSLPHAHPPSAVRENTEAKQQSRILPTSAPFTPSRNSSSAYIPHTTTSIAPADVLLARNSSLKASKASVSQARADVRSLATTIGLSRTVESQGAQGIPSQVLRSDDFPILEKGKEKIDMTSNPKILTPRITKPQVPAGDSLSTMPSVKTFVRLSTSGILNIEVPNSPAAKAANKTTAEVSATATSSAFPPLPPSAPMSAPVQSPSIRSNPKPLRLVSIPKSELISGSLSTPQSTSMVNQPGYHPPSRQPSLPSLSRLDQPGTPVSEIISEDASVTSNSLSRPCSPPLSKVGSAPVRSTTKSHQKKQRREAHREKERTEVDHIVDKPELDVEIAPIMGRKKKQKKERSTPVMSRASSPGPRQVVETEKPTRSEPAIYETPTTQTIQSDLALTGKRTAVAAKSEGTSGDPTLFPPIASIGDKMNEKPIPTPSSILADLVSSDVLDPDKLIILKSPASLNQRVECLSDLHGLDNKLVITDEDRTTLESGKPVRKTVQGYYRVMLTPNGDCVRNLTPVEEERYLELQNRILNDSGPIAFVPARHSASGGFALIGGRAVPNGPPTFFISGRDKANLLSKLDPVSIIQRDEALSYINQYVLPSLSTNSQLERALNAHALEAEALRPSNDSQSHVPWSINTTTATPPSTSSTSARYQIPYGVNPSDESFIQTGIEGMTAHFALPVQAPERTQALGNVTLLSLADSESAMQNAKKETEKLEKSLNQLLKKNRRLLLGTGH